MKAMQIFQRHPTNVSGVATLGYNASSKDNQIGHSSSVRIDPIHLRQQRRVYDATRGNGIILFLLLSFLANSLVAQECESLKSASAGVATEYLSESQPKTLPCVRVASERIERSDADIAIPTRIRLLGFKRPLSALEEQGVFFRGKGNEEMFPAIRSKASFGTKAEPRFDCSQRKRPV